MFRIGVFISWTCSGKANVRSFQVSWVIGGRADFWEEQERVPSRQDRSPSSWSPPPAVFLPSFLRRTTGWQGPACFPCSSCWQGPACFPCSELLYKFFWSIDLHFLTVMMEMRGDPNPESISATQWSTLLYCPALRVPCPHGSLIWAPDFSYFSNCRCQLILLHHTLQLISVTNWPSGSSAVTCNMFITLIAHMYWAVTPRFFSFYIDLSAIPWSQHGRIKNHKINLKSPSCHLQVYVFNHIYCQGL